MHERVGDVDSRVEWWGLVQCIKLTFLSLCNSKKLSSFCKSREISYLLPTEPRESLFETRVLAQLCVCAGGASSVVLA